MYTWPIGRAQLERETGGGRPTTPYMYLVSYRKLWVCQPWYPQLPVWADARISVLLGFRARVPIAKCLHCAECKFVIAHSKR